MLLHQIRKNYFEMTEVEKLASISAYRTKRLMELEAPAAIKVKSKAKASGASKETKPKLSPDEKALLKKLGISLKSLKSAE